MHPAAEIREQANGLRAAGHVAEADRLLETAFLMALIEAGGLPCACRIAPTARLPRPLASPAHGLVQVCRTSLLVHFSEGVDQTPAASLHMFAPIARMFSHIAAGLPDGGLREIIVNFSDGCETEGAYRRVSPSCARPDSVLIPDHHFVNSGNYADLRRAADAAPPWREREDKVFWRGSGIGRPLGPENRYQRLELCRRAQRSPFAGRLDAGVTDLAGILDSRQRPAAAGLIRPFAAKSSFLRYRYLIDIDGWSNSWVLLEKLIMGATVIKVGSAFGYRQWYYDRLKPWIHYVPVLPDLSDFDEKLAWMFAVPEECEKIAAAGRALAGEIRLDQEMAEAEGRIAAALRPAV